MEGTNRRITSLLRACGVLSDYSPDLCLETNGVGMRY